MSGSRLTPSSLSSHVDRIPLTTNTVEIQFTAYWRHILLRDAGFGLPHYIVRLFCPKRALQRRCVQTTHTFAGSRLPPYIVRFLFSKDRSFPYTDMQDIYFHKRALQMQSVHTAAGRSVVPARSTLYLICTFY